MSHIASATDTTHFRIMIFFFFQCRPIIGEKKREERQVRGKERWDFLSVMKLAPIAPANVDYKGIFNCKSLSGFHQIKLKKEKSKRLWRCYFFLGSRPPKSTRVNSDGPSRLPKSGNGCSGRACNTKSSQHTAFSLARRKVEICLESFFCLDSTTDQPCFCLPPNTQHPFMLY